MFMLSKGWKQPGNFELLNVKPFLANEKIFSKEAFSTLNVNKNILDLDELKCEPKSIHAADFERQA